jgi:hypothetical protein
MLMKKYQTGIRLLFATVLLWAASTSVSHAQFWSAVTTSDGSTVTARHEIGAVEYNGFLYVFGGRGERAVERYDTDNNVWEAVAQAPLDVVTQAPLEMHHFQPVVYNDKIYIIGAFTCCYPNEPTLPDIYVFDPADNSWTTDGVMPAERLRGAAGAFVRNGRIYIIGGNTRGHSGGAVGWFDEFNPADGSWRVLPDAPTPRDHFQAAVVGDKLIAVGGRQSNRSFEHTIANTDIFDFNSETWSSDADQLPTPRGGTMAVPYNNKVYVIGGESASMRPAHTEVEVFTPGTERWAALDNMLTPRHAGGAAMVGSTLHVFTGSDIRGARGETTSHEMIDLSQASTETLARTPPPVDTDADLLPDYDEVNIHFTDPENADTDGDGLNDYQEIFILETSALSKDTDDDGIEDKTEFDDGLDPTNADTDADGLLDGEELSDYNTDPINPDTDADGVSDGDEALVYTTDPNNDDSDSDSISDGIEINELNSDPLSTDSDADGLSDMDEYQVYGTSVSDADTDNDGLSDQEEIQLHLTNPLNEDTDGDFLSDGVEVSEYQSNPLNTDTDADGVSDTQEVVLGTSLTEMDEDGDGLINEIDGITDSDGDGLPNYIDLDSDNDTIPDVLELGYADVNQDGMTDDSALTPTAVTIDTDEDGIPDYLDVDSDQDGLSDYVEATSDFSNHIVRVTPTDSDANGIDDSYGQTALLPLDSDNDGIANHLELDSDGDGLFDIAEIGLIDADEDGRIDDFTDIDFDGISDNGIPALGAALPDSDADTVPDIIDPEHNRSGCVISGTPGPADPLLPTLLLASLLTLLRRQKTARNMP